MSTNKRNWNAITFGVSHSDAEYLIAMLSADIGALRAQGGPKKENVTLMRAYKIRQKLRDGLEASRARLKVAS